MNTRPKDSDEQYDKSPKKVDDTFCVGCGGTYHKQVKACPQCGQKNYEMIYNKGSLFDTVVIGVAIASLLVFIGVVLYFQFNY